MKIANNAGLALLTLVAGALTAQAQDIGAPNDGPPRDHRPPPLPLVLALDTNHDGIIDSNEIANASAELLTLDKNGDGQLTKDEYLPPRPPDADNSNRAFHPPPSPLIEALDVNHDGIIDSNEIANAPAELRTLDKNSDGQLTRDEYCPPPPRDRGNGDANDGPPQGPPPDGGPDGSGPDSGPPGPPQDQ